MRGVEVGRMRITGFLLLVLTACSAGPEPATDAGATEDSPSSVHDAAIATDSPSSVPDAAADAPVEAAVLGPITVDAPPVNGIMSVTVGQFYFGKYVIQSIDWGFLWLDTSSLTAGHVGVLGYCAGNIPPPVTHLYPVGDCNGTGGITTDGTRVIVTNLNSQCGVLCVDCNSNNRVTGRMAFGFMFGSWTWDQSYNTNAVPPTPTSPTTDPQGRSWTVSCTPPGPSVTTTYCTWTGQ